MLPAIHFFTHWMGLLPKHYSTKEKFMSVIDVILKADKEMPNSDLTFVLFRAKIILVDTCLFNQCFHHNKWINRVIIGNTFEVVFKKKQQQRGLIVWKTIFSGRVCKCNFESNGWTECWLIKWQRLEIHVTSGQDELKMWYRTKPLSDAWKYWKEWRK